MTISKLFYFNFQDKEKGLKEKLLFSKSFLKAFSPTFRYIAPKNSLKNYNFLKHSRNGAKNRKMETELFVELFGTKMLIFFRISHISLKNSFLFSEKTVTFLSIINFLIFCYDFLSHEKSPIKIKKERLINFTMFKITEFKKKIGITYDNKNSVFWIFSALVNNIQL